MTLPLSPTAFDERKASPLRVPVPPRPSRGRAAAAAITLLAHLGAVAALIAGIHVAPVTVAPKAMTVALDMEKPKPLEETAAPPSLIRPAPVTAPPPQIEIAQRASPIAAQPPQAEAPPPLPATSAPGTPAPAAIAGETRESFTARLLAQLNRFKRYPPQARRAHIQGVVMLHFVMAADGTVMRAEIAKSSGRPMLDDEALALIRRAQPLPHLPAGFPTPTLDAVVPIDFSLNG